MKAFQFQFSRNAECSFSSLSSALKSRILKKLSFFEKSSDPLSFAKRLCGLNNVFRFRIGEYRVIVTPKDREVLVVLLILKIGHRREVYKSQ